MTMSSGSIFSQNIMRITRTRHVTERDKSPTQFGPNWGPILSAAMYCSYIKSDFGTCAVPSSSSKLSPRVLLPVSSVSTYYTQFDERPDSRCAKMVKLANDVITIPATFSAHVSPFRTSLIFVRFNQSAKSCTCSRPVAHTHTHPTRHH